MNRQEKAILLRMIKQLSGVVARKVTSALDLSEFQRDTKEAVLLVGNIVRGLIYPVDDDNVAFDMVSLERVASRSTQLFRVEEYESKLPDRKERDEQLCFHYPDLTKGYREQKQWVEFCEYCGIRAATDGHHCLIHRMKKFKELGLPQNIMWVCNQCHLHNGELNSWEFRVRFWDTQCDRYGKETMVEWLNTLPLKIKPKFEVTK
jgi:hypothetical protein